MAEPAHRPGPGTARRGARIHRRIWPTSCTPLTVLSVDVDAVDDPEIRERLDDDLASGSPNGRQTIINTARRSAGKVCTQKCDAAAVVGDRVQFWQVLARIRASFQPVPPGPCPARAPDGRRPSPPPLDILFQNVFLHTDEGGLRRRGVGPRRVHRRDGLGPREGILRRRPAMPPRSDRPAGAADRPAFSELRRGAVDRRRAIRWRAGHPAPWDLLAAEYAASPKLESKRPPNGRSHSSFAHPRAEEHWIWV